MTIDAFKKMAGSFPHVLDAPHFERTAYKIIGKKIFATLDENSASVNLKFSPEDQSVYCLINKQAIYAVRNKWGLQGWTTIELLKVDSELMQDALQTAYDEALKKKKK